MAITVNRAAAGYARSLIGAGKVNNSAAWSFSEEDGKSLLGDPANWSNYGRHHLGIDETATENTAARHAYPIVKGGTLYRSALDLAATHADQAGDTPIAKAAKSLIEAVDAGSTTSSAEETMMERKTIVRFEVKTLQESGQFEGYGSTFGGTPDYYGDLIAPGAFKDTLREHHQKGTYPVMLYSHDSHGQCGEWLNMTEDNKGLFVEGKLWIDPPNPDPHALKAYRGMKMQRNMMGLSIGFAMKSFEYDSEKDIRTLTKVDLFEVSPTLFPANESARVVAVKAAHRHQTIREFEAHLRDVCGYSRDQARAIASHGFKAIDQTRDEDGVEKAIERLRAQCSGVLALFRKSST